MNESDEIFGRSLLAARLGGVDNTGGIVTAEQILAKQDAEDDALRESVMKDIKAQTDEEAAAEAVAQFRKEFFRLKRGHRELLARYNQLIFAVATKHPGETRHETALRYITERETPKPTDTAKQND